MKDVSEIISWLIEGAHNAAAPQALVEELCGRLIAAGIPLERAAFFVRTLVATENNIRAGAYAAMGYSHRWDD
jgi:hypothetical protein